MDAPDQRLFEQDIASAEFLIGAASNYWGLAEPELLPDGLSWPKRILWMRPAVRPNAPERFYVLLDLAGYRSASPTGAFWDAPAKAALPTAKWPKGKPESRFAKVFRTDWDNAVAFYHPYDRHGAQTHRRWPQKMPHLIWTPQHTIVDYLEEFHSLLNCGDYVGV